jgi:hypothetical protein
VTADLDAGSAENQNIYKLMKIITNWIKINTSSDEFREFKARQIGYVLSEEWERQLGIMASPLEEIL